MTSQLQKVLQEFRRVDAKAADLEGTVEAVKAENREANAQNREANAKANALLTGRVESIENTMKSIRIELGEIHKNIRAHLTYQDNIHTKITTLGDALRCHERSSREYGQGIMKYCEEYVHDYENELKADIARLTQMVTERVALDDLEQGTRPAVSEGGSSQGA